MYYFALFLMALGACCIVWTRAHWTAVALFLFGAVFVFKPAFGHDHSHPERNDWLKSLHSKDQTWCCDGNDTDAIEAWEAKGKNYRVKFKGEWFDVPEGAVVGGPNQTGDALLWMNKGYGGTGVRCFMPGSMI